MYHARRDSLGVWDCYSHAVSCTNKKKRTAHRVSSGKNIGTDTLLDIKNRQQIKAFSYDC